MAVNLEMNLLFVDNYKTMLWILRNFLKQNGFDNIDEVADGALAALPAAYSGGGSQPGACGNGFRYALE